MRASFIAIPDGETKRLHSRGLKAICPPRPATLKGGLVLELRIERARTTNDVAGIVRDVLRRLDGLLGAPHFNLTLGTAPIGDEEKRYFLWHIDVLPRLATPAGFELGSGTSINPVRPEQAARELCNIGADGGAQ